MAIGRILLALVSGRAPAMLLNANCTVTICHSRTKDLATLVRQADIVVGAVGKPEFIRADWIKDGAVVVDAGYHPGGVGDSGTVDGPTEGASVATGPVGLGAAWHPETTRAQPATRDTRWRDHRRLLDTIDLLRASGTWGDRDTLRSLTI